MKFTKDKPTQRGWYWYYLESDAGGDLTIAKVDIEGMGLRASLFEARPNTGVGPKPVEDMDGYWCPIPRPPLPEGSQKSPSPVMEGPEGMKKAFEEVHTNPFKRERN